MKLQKIFEKIEGKKWDWFNYDMSQYEYSISELGSGSVVMFEKKTDRVFSLSCHSIPELLANKSWNQAVGITQEQSLIAFSIFQSKGEDQCLDYILRTMIDTNVRTT